MVRDRSWRRAQRERLKHKRKHYWMGHAGSDDRMLGIVVDTPRPCSCIMCGNPRRHFGQRSVQELRMERYDD